MDILDVYVAKHCFGCEEALNMAAGLKKNSKDVQVNVNVLDELEAADLPENVFTPSYYLNGKLLFWGNPRPDELCSKIAELKKHKEL